MNDIGNWLWGLWILAFFIIEGIAIWRNEYDTLSEKVWNVNKKHKVLRAITFLLALWAGIHLIEECALGICKGEILFFLEDLCITIGLPC